MLIALGLWNFVLHLLVACANQTSLNFGAVVGSSGLYKTHGHLLPFFFFCLGKDGWKTSVRLSRYVWKQDIVHTNIQKGILIKNWFMSCWMCGQLCELLLCICGSTCAASITKAKLLWAVTALKRACLSCGWLLCPNCFEENLLSFDYAPWNATVSFNRTRHTAAV